MKYAIGEIFQLTNEQLNGALKETVLPDIGKSPRQLMQTLGTEWGRQMIGENTWIAAWKRGRDQEFEDWAMTQELHWGRKITDDHKDEFFNDAVYVVPDIRFENEAEWVREEGGIVLHLFRPDAEEVSVHSSEAGVSVAYNDFQIHNDGTIAALTEKVDALLRALKGQRT
jgi:hypothetical protein